MVGDFITTIHSRNQLSSLRETNEINSTSSCLGPLVFLAPKDLYIICSDGFRSRDATGYFTCEARLNSPPSRLEEDGSVLNQFE